MVNNSRVKGFEKETCFLLNLAVSVAKWFGFTENLKNNNFIVYAVFWHANMQILLTD